MDLRRFIKEKVSERWQNLPFRADVVRSVTGERPEIRSVSGYVAASRADVVTDDMDISEKFMCAVDASSVGTVVDGKTRVADEDVIDPEDVGVERIWPSVCSLFRPHGFESSPCVDETILPTLLLVSPTSVLPFLSLPMNIPLLFLDMWKTDLRGFLSSGRIMKGVPFPCSAGLGIDGAYSVLLGFVLMGSIPESSVNGGRALPRKEVPTPYSVRSTQESTDSVRHWGVDWPVSLGFG